MPADTTVKFLHSAMTGAPTLSGTAGAMIALLDACLVNGFGSGTVDSVVVSSGVATVTRSAGHPFEVGSVTLMTGATGSWTGLNGEKRVLSKTATTYTFDATGVSDGTATGTITHKMAALGFAKPYSGTNLAAYKSPNILSPGAYLRVDDTGTVNARVVGYEAMSDVNTGTGPFPTNAQISGGGYWPKAVSADATARSWILVGDDRGFILYLHYGSWNAALTSVSNTSASVHFGDFESVKSPDPYASSLSCATSSITSSAGASDFSYCNSSSSTTVASYAPRSFSGVGSAAGFVRSSLILAGANSGYMSGANGILYPNPADNSLHVAPIYLGEAPSGSWVYRGKIPGIYFSPMLIGTSAFGHRDTVSSVTGLSGRTLLALCNGTGVLFVDLTGPWR